MTKKQRMVEIANTTPKTIENWRRTKPLLIEAIEFFLAHQDRTPEMELEVSMDEDTNNLSIKNRATGTIYSLPYQDSLSYFKNVLRAMGGSKYGIVNFVAKKDYDLFVVKELL